MIVELTGQFEGGITEVEWTPDTESGDEETMKVGRFIYIRKKGENKATYLMTDN